MGGIEELRKEKVKRMSGGSCQGEVVSCQKVERMRPGGVKVE